jgi:hypothetical protein
MVVVLVPGTLKLNNRCYMCGSVVYMYRCSVRNPKLKRTDTVIRATWWIPDEAFCRVLRSPLQVPQACDPFCFIAVNNPAPHHTRDPPPFDVHLRHYASWTTQVGGAVWSIPGVRPSPRMLTSSRPPCSTCQYLSRYPVLGKEIRESV